LRGFETLRLTRTALLKALLPCALVGASLFLAGCPSSGGGTAGTTTTTGGTTTGGAAGSGGDIKIGLYASLTGANATFGTDCKEGAELAMKEINASGGVDGKQIALETLDDESKPEAAATVAQRLAGDAEVVAVLGEVASSITKSAAPVFQAAGIPMVTPSSTNVDVTKIGDHIFRTCFIDSFQGYVMAKFAKDNLKAGKVAVFRDQKNDYSVGLADAFTAEYKKMGGTIATDVSYKQGDNDFRAQLSQIKAANPQAVFVPGYYGDLGPIARQAKELGLNVPILGGDGWDSDVLVKGAGGPGGALEGAYFSNHYSKDDKNPVVQSFVKAYQSAYNKPPSAVAACAYDGMKLLADAVKRAGGPDRDKVTKAIAETKDFAGVTGTISINGDRNAVKPATVLQIKGDEFRFSAQIAPPGMNLPGPKTTASPGMAASPSAATP